MTQDAPLHRLDSRERYEAIGDPPTRADLLRQWLSDQISLDEYAALMDRYFPMTLAEYAAHKAILRERGGTAAESVPMRDDPPGWRGTP